MIETAKTVVDSFREAIQDLLVPELKAIRVSVDSLRTEMHLRTENLQRELQLRDEMLKAEIHALGQKLDFAIDIRERLAGLEARLPKQ